MSPHDCWLAVPAGAAILQSELLSNVVEIRVNEDTIGAEAGLEFYESVHPLAIVVSQDCDLDLDFKAREDPRLVRRQIDHVLCCDIDDAQAMRERGQINTTRWGWVKSYQDERYHVLPGLLGGMLGVDFRRVFAIPTVELYRRIEIGEAVRLCYLSPIYRDHLSNRFYGYHMRVALEEQSS